jgi:hypothetical protein
MGEGRPKLTIPVVRFDVVPIWDVDKDARRWASRCGLVVAEDTMLPLQVCHVLVLGEAFDVEGVAKAAAVVQSRAAREVQLL